MQIIRETHFLQAFFLILLLCGGLRAQNCICEDSLAPSEAFADAYAVFTGKVLRAETNWMSGGMKYTFEVKKGWKKEMDPIAYVSSGWEQDCGILFKEGQTYLVYAQKTFTALKTNRCMGSKLQAKATEELAMWGDGSPPEARSGKAVAQMIWTLTGLTLAGMVFLAFVVLRKKFQKSPDQ